MAFSLGTTLPYLNLVTEIQLVEQIVTIWVSGEQSALTLTISQINALGSAGQANVSGSLNSQQISWTGQIDLTANPFTTRVITGWPPGAFSHELTEALYFEPVFDLLAESGAANKQASPIAETIAPLAGKAVSQQPKPGQPSLEAIFFKAAAWGIAGAIIAGLSGGTGLVVLGSGIWSADASLADSLISEIDSSASNAGSGGEGTGSGGEGTGSGGEGTGSGGEGTDGDGSSGDGDGGGGKKGPTAPQQPHWNITAS